MIDIDCEVVRFWAIMPGHSQSRSLRSFLRLKLVQTNIILGSGHSDAVYPAALYLRSDLLLQGNNRKLRPVNSSLLLPCAIPKLLEGFLR